MERIYSILLVSLFTPFVWAMIFGESSIGSGFATIDKIIKPVLIFALLVGLLVRGNWGLRRNIATYFAPALLFFLILLIHYAFSTYSDENFPALKEIVRFTGFIIILLCASMVQLKDKDYTFLLIILGFMALPLALLSLYHSYTGELDKSWKYVGGYLRAGSGIVDANTLGAVINLASLSALGCFLIVKNATSKIFFLLSFLASQAARFSTFSTGSFINIVIAFFVILYMLRKYDRGRFRQVLSIGLLGVLVITIFMAFYGLFEVAFYRITFSDEKVVQASIGSRLSQYHDLIVLLAKKPYIIITGVGNTDARSLMGNGLDFHNAYLRPLLTAGIFSFLAFIYLCWRSFINYRHAINVAYSNGDKIIPYVILFAAFTGWSFQAATIPADVSVVQWFFIILSYSLYSIKKSANEN